MKTKPLKEYMESRFSKEEIDEIKQKSKKQFEKMQSIREEQYSYILDLMQDMGKGINVIIKTIETEDEYELMAVRLDVVLDIEIKNPSCELSIIKLCLANLISDYDKNHIEPLFK